MVTFLHEGLQLRQLIVSVAVKTIGGWRSETALARWKLAEEMRADAKWANYIATGEDIVKIPTQSIDTVLGVGARTKRSELQHLYASRDSSDMVLFGVLARMQRSVATAYKTHVPRTSMHAPRGCGLVCHATILVAPRVMDSLMRVFFYPK